jgi:hypothetical protein
MQYAGGYDELRKFRRIWEEIKAAHVSLGTARPFLFGGRRRNGGAVGGRGQVVELAMCTCYILPGRGAKDPTMREKIATPNPLVEKGVAHSPFDNLTPSPLAGPNRAYNHRFIP